MFEKTQEDIKRNWKEDGKALVTIICITYNHKKYINHTLDSFLNQKTSFPFVVLIHDDASNDGTTDIIIQYANRYPDIIKPIFQTTNQYSKGHDNIIDFILPRVETEYVAICEGDDYWSSSEKLQKSYNYMNRHPGCSLVSHLTDMENGSLLKVTRFNPHKFCRGGVVGTDDIIVETNIIHTSSFFLRKSTLSDNLSIFKKYGTYDAVMVMLAATEGYVYIIPSVMSVYRLRTEGSWSRRISDDNDKLIDIKRHLIHAASDINKYRNYEFDHSFRERNRKARFEIYLIQGDIKKIYEKKYRDLLHRLNIIDHILLIIKMLPKPIRRYIHNTIRPRFLWAFYKIQESNGFIQYKG